ncbi:MAG TPA: sugar ABC transporter permease [Firmicutes bacterium]|nr:sugar ABC transporter permease [Bacillota bacterium]
MAFKRKEKDGARVPILRQMWDARASYVLMAPFLLLFLVFVVIPVVASVALSFTSFNMLQVPQFVGVDNYIRMFLEDDVFVTALKNTLVFAVITGPVGYVLSFVVAWLINELNRGIRWLLTLVMYVPTLAGNVYYIWTYIFSTDSKGLVNSALIGIGIINDPIQWLTDSSYSFYVVLIVIIWLSLGAGFLSFVAGLQSLDRSYFEAAAIDGVRNRFQELWYVTLPQMVPQLLFGAVMSISSAFAVGYQSASITGFPSSNYSTHTILLHMLDYGTIRFEMGYASAIAVVLFAIMLLSWVLIQKALRKLT